MPKTRSNKDKNRILLFLAIIAITIIIFLVSTGKIKIGTQAVTSGTCSFSVAYGNYPISTAILYHSSGSASPTGIYPDPSNQAYWWYITNVGTYVSEVKLRDYPLTFREIFTCTGSGVSRAKETVCGSSSELPALSCRTYKNGVCIQKCTDASVTCVPSCTSNQYCNQVVGPTMGDCITNPGCQYNNPSCAANQDCISNTCVLKSGCSYNNPSCTASQDCISNMCVLKTGCTYNNPACGANYDCISNSCILKTGCAYNNPACGTNYDCISNSCVLKSGCAYNNPACTANYNCVNNVCVLKSGCAYNNPVCPSGQTCTNNVCVTNLKADGNACAANSECINNYCFQNICRKDTDGDGNPDYFDSCNMTAQPSISCLVDGAKVLPYNAVSFSFIPQIQNMGNTISNLQITSIKFNNTIVSFTSEIKQTNPGATSTFSIVTVTGLGSLPLDPAGSKIKYSLVIIGKTTSIYYASDTTSAQMTYYFVKG